jgi:hypothetical protein
MTQRMVSHPFALPQCRAGHNARHIHDARQASAGGGHLVECACSTTSKHVEFDDALGEWCRTQGKPLPVQEAPPAPVTNVTPMRARTWP